MSERLSKKEIYLKPGEVAKILNVDTKTLRNWYKKGLIHAEKLPSGRLRYPQSEIDRILGKKPVESLRGTVWRRD